MEIQESQKWESIYVIYSKKASSILNHEEKNQVLKSLIKKINNENPQEIETWIVKVNKHEICGIFIKDDINFPGDSLTILFQSEYENPSFYI